MGTVHPFNPNNLRLAPGEANRLNQTARQKRKPKRPRPAKYVQVEMEWFTRAASVAMASRSPAALIIAQLLYRAAFMDGTLTPTMPTKALNDAGVTPGARRRGLKALAEAGLVTLDPRPNKNPRVTVCCDWLQDYMGGKG